MNENNELSFLPDDYLTRKVRRRTTLGGTAALIAAIAGAGYAVITAERSLRAAEIEHASVVHTCNDAAQRVQGLRRSRQEQWSIIRRAALASALLDNVPPGNVMAELTNALPQGASLLEVSLETSARQDTSAATAFDMKKAALEAQRKGEMSGVADLPIQEVSVGVCGLADTDIQVAQYLSQLSHCPLFKDVALVISEAHPLPGDAQTIMRRFQIQMTINRNARLTPVQSPAPAAVAEIAR